MRLTLEELLKLRDLWQAAWGTQNKTWAKLDAAVERRQEK